MAIANIRLYVNYADGFVGTGLKKDEFVAEVSDLDDIIAITKSGTMKVVRVSGQNLYRQGYPPCRRFPQRR